MTVFNDAILDNIWRATSDLCLVEQDYARVEGTKIISNAIINTCKKHKYTCRPEVEFTILDDNKHRQGFIDFITENENRKYAIEIDSSNKKWSLRKLQYLETQGYITVWLRWCIYMKIDKPNGVHLFDFTPSKDRYTSHRLKRRRRLREQRDTRPTLFDILDDN